MYYNIILDVTKQVSIQFIFINWRLPKVHFNSVVKGIFDQ